MNEKSVTFGNIIATRWQDPYGPSHSFFLSVPHIEQGIPQPCSEANWNCVRVLVGQPNARGELEVSVPHLSNIQFGIQVLGFKMPWAWNQYLKNRVENDKQHSAYMKRKTEDYLADFRLANKI